MWRTVSTLLLAGVILGGLSGRAAVASSRPNQGIWLSLRNAATAAVVLALPIFALTWSIRGPLYATYAALLAALVAASLMGMAVFFRHFLLRAMLRGSGQIPWRYGRFLDHGAQLALLRKVGGGYLFAHTLLQAHLAEN